MSRIIFIATLLDAFHMILIRFITFPYTEDHEFVQIQKSKLSIKFTSIYGIK